MPRDDAPTATLGFWIGGGLLAVSEGLLCLAFIVPGLVGDLPIFALPGLLLGGFILTPTVYRSRNGMRLAIFLLASHLFLPMLWCLWGTIALLWIPAAMMGWDARRDQLRYPANYGLPDLCESCDYDLTGNLSGICPECGTQISPRLAPPQNGPPAGGKSES